MGNWEGGVKVSTNWTKDMNLQIETQDKQNFLGHASTPTTGAWLSCNSSKVTLIPDSENIYSVTFVGGGCKGSGKLKHNGDTLGGKVRFDVGAGQKAIKLTKISSKVGPTYTQPSLTKTAMIEQTMSTQGEPRDLCDVFTTEMDSQSGDWIAKPAGRYRVSTDFREPYSPRSAKFKVTSSGEIKVQIDHHTKMSITDCNNGSNGMLSCTMLSQASWIPSPGNHQMRVRFSKDFTRFCGYIFPVGSTDIAVSATTSSR